MSVFLFFSLLFAAVHAQGVVSVSPPVLKRSGDEAVISWTKVSNPSSDDAILIRVGNVDLGKLPVSGAATWKQGFGSVKFPAVNMRQPMWFTYTQNSTTIGSGLPVTFSSMAEVTNIHLALTNNPDEMRVQFQNNANAVPFVELQLGNSSKTFTGSSVTYFGKDLCNAPANSTGFIDPGFFHDVLLTGLAPSTLYRYRVGLGRQVYTDWINFVSAPPTGASSEFVSFLAFGDMGVKTPFEHTQFWRKHGVEQQEASAKTVPLLERYVAEGVPGFRGLKKNEMDAATHKRVARRWGRPMSSVKPDPRMIICIGDISYARGMSGIWDYYMQTIESSAASAPFMVGIGNHEYDYPKASFNPGGHSYGDDSLGECGVPYAARFHMPEPHPAKPIPWKHRSKWYSYNYGPVHFAIVSSETDFLQGSDQHNWLTHDLASVNRSVTPWLIVMLHRPLYTSSGGGGTSELTSLLRSTLNPLLHKFKVDICFYGHVHAYERVCGLTPNEECAPRDEDGVVYMLVGGAGNDYMEGWDTHSYIGHKIQPEWSVFRTINHGITEFRVNGTYLEMIFLGAQRGDVHDRLVLEK